MNKENRRIYEFGAFRLDPTARLLLRDGKPIALTPKVFETLLILVQNHGALVEKEQLMKELWADSFVEENNLTYNISTLRKALGEKAASHQYIITVPGHGYRFAAEVREVEEKPTVEAESSAPVISHKAKSKVFVAAGLLIIVAIALFWWVARKPSQSLPPSPVPDKSIAVLPFKLVTNDTGDAEMEYLSDGISESLINDLSQLPGVKVISRSSSLQYRGKELEPQKVAKALGVEMILTGSVWRHNEQVQISVELMRASDNRHVWGEQYQRQMADLLSLQTDISREIAEKLRLKLTNVEQQQLVPRDTVSLQATTISFLIAAFLNPSTWSV